MFSPPASAQTGVAKTPHASSESAPTPRTAVPVPIQPPWTPNHHSLAFPADDDDSSPTEPPSPYSPPPKSLMSDDDSHTHDGGDGVDESKYDFDDSRTTVRTNTVQRPRRRRTPLQHRQVSSAPPQGAHPDSNIPRYELLPAVRNMKSDLESSHQSITLLQQENSALTMEVNRFQKEMGRWSQAINAAQTAQRTAQDRATAAEVAVRELKLQHETALAQHAEQAQAATDAAVKKKENEMFEEIVTKERKNQELVEELKQQVKTLQEGMADATEREQALLLEKEAMSAQLKERVAKGEQGSVSLQKQLAESIAAQQALEAEVESKQQALQESYSRYQTVRAEKDALQKEKQQLRRRSHSPTSKEKELQETLAKTNEELAQVRRENEKLMSELSTRKDGSASSNKENDVPDRLARIRDAAERSAIVQGHVGELARVKQEHEEALKTLTKNHEQDLRDVVNESKSKVSSRVRELRRKMHQDYEAKFASIERRLKVETERAKKECEANIAAAEEAVSEATQDVAKIQQKLNQSTSRREELEVKVRDLERKLTVETQKSKLNEQLMTDRKQWNSETRTLLKNLQKECNSVFEQRLSSHQSVAPSAASRDLLDESNFSIVSSALDDISVAPKTPWTDWTKKPATSYASPLDVSHAIDETEAMVRNFVDGNHS